MQAATVYEQVLNSTVMPNYRAVAFKNMTAAQTGAEGPLGYVDFETNDGNILLAIFFAC